MLFDFLFDHQSPAAGKAQAVSTEGVDPNSVVGRQLGPSADLQAAPQMQNQPGLLHRLWDYAKSPDGMLAIGTALRSAGGDDGALQDQARIQQGWQQQRKEQQALAYRQAMSRAFKAGYGPDGKWDQARYAASLPGDADPMDVAAVVKAFAPRGGVDGSFSYTIDPGTGEAHWGEQRPMSYAEKATESRDAETARYHELLDQIARGKLAVAQQNAGTASYRAHKAPASAKGATSGAGMADVEAELRRRGLLQ